MSLLIGNTPERIYIPHKENAAIACDVLNVSADTLVVMNEQGGKSICCLESQTPDRMLLYAFLWQDCLGRSTTKRRKKYLWTSGLPRNHRLPQLSQGRNVPVSAVTRVQNAAFPCAGGLSASAGRKRSSL